MMVDDERTHERTGGAAPVAEAAAAPSPVAAFGSTGGGRSAVADAPLARGGEDAEKGRDDERMAWARRRSTHSGCTRRAR